MTVEDNFAIDRLRDELHEYHVDVQKLITRCEGCGDLVNTMKLDLYGLPGRKEDGQNPGLLGDVADLKNSRKRLRLGLNCIWAFLMAVAGTVGAVIVKKWDH